MDQAIRPGVLETLQSGVTALGNGTAYAVPANVVHHIFYVEGVGQVTAGAVSLETATNPSYAGTWAPLVSQLATPTTNPVVLASTTQKVFYFEGVLAAIRARVSTTVTGTTASCNVYYKGEAP